jgi:hypothetical protein
MAYETIIGDNQLLYEITLPGSPALVVNLLSSSDLNELKTWDIEYRSQNRRLSDVVVLDGFIFSENVFGIRHKLGGAVELFAAESKAYFPYTDWHKKVYVSGSGTALVKFVIGFTKRPNVG